MEKITTPESEVAVAKHLGVRECIIVPNISWGFNGMHECDVFAIRRSGYAVEVEIKCSKSDLIADARKMHRKKPIDARISEVYFAFQEKYYPDWSEYVPDYAGILTIREYADGKFHATRRRNAKRNKLCRVLTEKEQLLVARLGTLRIWNLKDTLNKRLKNGKN